MSNLYETDYYGWANEQARLLRAGQLTKADIENIAEEIESMGKGEKRELVNRLVVLLQHLLKWEYQPERRSRSWRITIAIQRDQIARHMIDNPSLKPKVEEAMRDAYRTARLQAAVETDMKASFFPSDCPYLWAHAVDEAFWPGPASPSAEP